MHRVVYVALLFLITWSLSCGKIEVTGKTSGTRDSNTSTVAELNINRGSLDTVGQQRVVRFDGTDENLLFDKFKSKLDIAITGNPSELSESYLYINVFQNESEVSGGTSAERSFVVNSIGRSTFQRIRRGEPLQETAISSKHHLGFGYLAVVQDNDRMLPWRIPPGAPNCIPSGKPDCLDSGESCDGLSQSERSVTGCLDMESISKSLFDLVSSAVRPVVRENVPFGGVFYDELVYVPNLVQNNFENDGHRARGFGFIYRAQIQVPLASADVYVPLSLIFEDDVTVYRLSIDPISLNSSRRPDPQNIRRILVRGSPGANLFEGNIRDKIVEAITELPPPPSPSGAAFEDFMYAGIDAAIGRTADLTGRPARTSPTYNFFLAPEEVQNELTSMVIWHNDRGGPAKLKTKVRLHIIE